MATNATYTRLKSGEWGIRATIPVRQGDLIEVGKKDGGSNTEQVERVLFTDKKIWLCAIIATRKAQRERMGSGHGQAAPVAGYSQYCTDNASCRCFDCI